MKPAEAETSDGPALEAELAALFAEPFTELAFAGHVTAWEQDEAAHGEALKLAAHYAAWAVLTPAGRERNRAGILFKVPAKLDYAHLVPLVSSEANGYAEHRIDQHHIRRREGFALTDHGTDLNGALDQANYCIWCHNQIGRASCRERV